jgi:predicted GIY-YIG superfamily endonuclease
MAYLNKIIGIYSILSIIDNKFYIGRSCNCYERFSKHKCLLSSFYQAGKFTKLDPYKISLCCKGKQKRVKNTIWKYIKKED